MQVIEIVELMVSAIVGKAGRTLTRHKIWTAEKQLFLSSHQSAMEQNKSFCNYPKYQLLQIIYCVINMINYLKWPESNWPQHESIQRYLTTKNLAKFLLVAQPKTPVKADTRRHFQLFWHKPRALRHIQVGLTLETRCWRSRSRNRRDLGRKYQTFSHDCESSTRNFLAKNIWPTF